MKSATVLLFLLISIMVAAQSDTLNRVDSLGKRYGYWKVTAAMKKLGPPWKYDDILEEGNYVDSKKTGVWIEYWPTGKVKSSMVFANNRPNGTATLYFENGNVRETGTWRGTRWIGEYKLYYEDTTLRYHFNFDNLGQKSGMQYYYYPNGKLAMSVSSKDGKEDGWCREYDDDGTLVKEIYYSPYPDSCKTITHPSKKPQRAIHDHDYDYDPTGPQGKEEEDDYTQEEMRLPEQENY